jgi:hypothetical protein
MHKSLRLYCIGADNGGKADFEAVSVLSSHLRLSCFGDVFEAADDEGGPAGLVAGAEALAGLGVEELVEEQGLFFLARAGERPRAADSFPQLIAAMGILLVERRASQW